MGLFTRIITLVSVLALGFLYICRLNAYPSPLARSNYRTESPSAQRFPGLVVCPVLQVPIGSTSGIHIHPSSTNQPSSPKDLLNPLAGSDSLHGRKEGQPVESHMYSWYPASSGHAIIPNPPVIILGQAADQHEQKLTEEERQVMSKKQVVVKETPLPPQRLTPAKETKKSQEDSGNHLSTIKEDESFPTYNWPKLLSLECTITIQNSTMVTENEITYSTLNVSPIEVVPTTHEVFYPSLGANIQWVESCFDVRPDPSRKAFHHADHIGCDITLQQDHAGEAHFTGETMFQFADVTPNSDTLQSDPNNLKWEIVKNKRVTNFGIQTSIKKHQYCDPCTAFANLIPVSLFRLIGFPYVDPIPDSTDYLVKNRQSLTGLDSSRKEKLSFTIQFQSFRTEIITYGELWLTNNSLFLSLTIGVLLLVPLFSL